MLKAILYKEWIKSRWYLAVAFAVTCAFAGYAMLRLYRALGMMGAGHIWEVMVTRNAVFVEQMEYVPLLAGLLLAVVQFAPEMHRKCLKLTLHLPVPGAAGDGDHAAVRRRGADRRLRHEPRPRRGSRIAGAAARARRQYRGDAHARGMRPTGGLPVRRMGDSRTDVEAAGR